MKNLESRISQRPSFTAPLHAIKLISPILLVVAVYLSAGAVLAAAIEIKVDHERLEIVDVSKIEGGVQASALSTTVSLAAPPGNAVTARASISGNIPGVKVSEGSALVFTPENYSTAQRIVISFPQKVSAGQSAALVLGGSGLQTKTINVNVVASGASGGSSDTTTPSGGGKFTPGLPVEPGQGEVTFAEYFSSLVNVGIIVAIAISVLITIYAGILYAQSQGEASKIALAKELVAGCLTGLAILLLIKLILPTLGITP